MLSGFLLSLREGLEAALVVGIVFGVFRILRRKDLNQSAWWGVAAGILASLLVAAALFFAGAQLEGEAEEIFEAISMLLAAGLLTWMIIWVQAQSGGMHKDIKKKVLDNSSTSGKWQIFSLTFLAVLREGVELALFLIATTFVGNQNLILAGGLLGLVAAVTIGLLWYRSSGGLSLSSFFKVTNVLLVLFAAGLIAHAVHALNELGLVPSILDPLYNLNGLLSEDSFVGQLLKTLFGYRSTPSLTVVASYMAYMSAIVLILLKHSSHIKKKTVSAIIR
jgi:high-affinity iron transporter